MNCQHARIKVLDKEEAFCWDCLCTVNVGSVPIDLQQPKNEVRRNYDLPPTRGRDRAYKVKL